MLKCHKYGNIMCNVMTYYQGLFTSKGEKCFLIQAHENELLHLSLMGNKSYGWNAFSPIILGT